MIALITKKPLAIVQIFDAVPNPLRLPNGDQVAAVAVGWAAGGFALVEVEAFAAPGGKVITGAASYSIDKTGNVSESYAVADPTAPAVSAEEFRALFTPAEKIAITTAAESDALIRVFMDDAEAAPSIDLASQPVADGLNYLLANGLLTGDRLAAIARGGRP